VAVVKAAKETAAAAAAADKAEDAGECQERPWWQQHPRHISVVAAVAEEASGPTPSPPYWHHC